MMRQLAEVLVYLHDNGNKYFMHTSIYVRTYTCTCISVVPHMCIYSVLKCTPLRSWSDG